jgi:hypothetical protein
MKYVKFVETTPICDPISDKVVGKVTQREVLLGLTAMPLFVSGKTGIEAIELALAARTAVREQAGDVTKVGFWALEDDHAERLIACAKAYPFDGVIAESALPFLRAVAGQTSEPPVAAARPAETNGATAVEHAPS